MVRLLVPNLANMAPGCASQRMVAIAHVSVRWQGEEQGLIYQLAAVSDATVLTLSSACTAGDCCLGSRCMDTSPYPIYQTPTPVPCHA